MFQVNLLIFPIIAGYYILIRSELFRYRQQRLESQKLIFNSFLAGFFLLLGSWALTGLVSIISPSFVSWIRQWYPVSTPYFGTCFCSFPLALIFTELTNLAVRKTTQITRAINSTGNEFERLCAKCYTEFNMVQFTLKNDKCYVGWLKSLPVPSHSSYITLLPVYSGYRKKDTKELVFTTQYLDVYASYVSDGITTDVSDLNSLVIKIDEIVSANLFDSEMYDRFNNGDAVESETNTTAP